MRFSVTVANLVRGYALGEVLSGTSDEGIDALVSEFQRQFGAEDPDFEEAEGLLYEWLGREAKKKLSCVQRETREFLIVALLLERGNPGNLIPKIEKFNLRNEKSVSQKEIAFWETLDAELKRIPLQQFVAIYKKWRPVGGEIESLNRRTLEEYLAEPLDDYIEEVKGDPTDVFWDTSDAIQEEQKLNPLLFGYILREVYKRLPEASVRRIKSSLYALEGEKNAAHKEAVQKKVALKALLELSSN